MFNFFGKREIRCERCYIPLEKNKYHFFDATYRRLYKQAERLKLCTSCLMEKYKEYLNFFQYKAIVVEPFKPLNAYQFYSFQQMKKYNFRKEDIEKMKILISRIKRHCDCGRSARFLWCSPEVYFRDVYKFNMNSEYKGDSLCIKCLCNHLKNIITREQIYFDEVFPPIGESDGLITAFEC